MSKATFHRIHEVELFGGCRKSELNRIDQLGFNMVVPAGRTLCAEGEPGSEFFVLLDGLVEVTTSAGDNALLRPGAWFGEAALVNNVPRSATVRTRVDSVVIVYNRREFNTLLSVAPCVRKRISTASRRVAAGSRPSNQPWYQPLTADARTVSRLLRIGNASTATCALVPMGYLRKR
jgi:CRP-like cAMP-binding protein